MNVERLQHLKVVLGKVDPAKLRMEIFGRHYGAHPPEKNHFCRTSACAFGWAALDPEFQKQGLVGTWIFDGFWHDLIITYEGKEYFEAAAEFFGLSEDDALFLFEPGKYPSADREHSFGPVGIEDVIKHIDVLLAKQEPS